MNNIYKIKRYRQQRITFNSPVIYSTAVEYIAGSRNDSKVSRNKEEAYAFKSIEYAVKLLSILNKNTYESEWKIVEIIDGKDLLVDEDIVNIYKNKHTIDKYRQEIEELNRKVAKLEVGSPYKKVLDAMLIPFKQA